MKKSSKKSILVTGGAGFIGSAVVRTLVARDQWQVVNIDKLTYAGHLESLSTAQNSPSHKFIKMDICDQKIGDVLAEYQPEGIMHLAAESHVDRSIDGPAEFLNTNIIGTFNLLQAALSYWQGLDVERRKVFRFHHVSTDEVYGSLGPSGLFTEKTAYRPNSPYSASKASSDHLVRAWHKTYGLPVVISNCSNNYGPYQFPEKLIPLIIFKAISEEPLPVYGTGQNIRDWLYVLDHAEALLCIFEKGKIGEVYNVGGFNEKTNIEVVTAICGILDELRPLSGQRSYKDLITFVVDRPGHDLRYAIDANKLKRELNWSPRETFESGIKKTVDWYLENQDWCKTVMQRYRGERLGGRA